MTNIKHSLPWLEGHIQHLKHYIHQGRIPQALLLTGHKGFGKQYLAEHFAKSLLCFNRQADSGYCGQCQSCILFDAKTHPDYIFRAPEEAGKVIGVDVIRQLTAKLALKPQFDSHRVVVINPADSLNKASANAFLKYLEEPTERTSLILITDKPAKLLATIKSRCQKLFIDAADKAIVKTWLQQQGISENADLLLNLAQGSPLLAKEFFDSGLLDQRFEFFNHWLKVAKLDETPVEVAEKWHKLDKTIINLLLFWLISWVTDMIKLNYQQPVNKIINQDFTADLQELAKRLDLKQLYKYYDLLLLNQKRFDTQLNKQLMFEEILIQWSQLNSR